MFNKNKLFIMLIISVMAFVFAQSAFAKQNYTKDYIDPRLPEKEQVTMKKIMQSLDKEDRENVLFIDEDGCVIANRLELIEEFKKQNKDKFNKDGKLKKIKKVTPVNEEVLPNGDLDLISIASTGYIHPSVEYPSANSGPFRRVLSTEGHSRLIANIYLPAKTSGEAYMNPKTVTNCTHDTTHTTTGDKGYIYTGAVTSGGQIDMGLALNYDAGPNFWNETWGMFVEGAEVITPDYGNYKLGQTVFFKYYSPQNNQAALYVSGLDKSGNTSEHTLVVAVSSTKGFRTDGQGMKIKRITSVGQSVGHEDLTTGSYIKNVGWNNVKIGTYSGSEELMNSTNTSEFGGYKLENILVDYTDQANEKVWVKCGTL